MPRGRPLDIERELPRRLVNMLMYLVQHDAHHRGQITSLPRDLGHEFASQDYALSSAGLAATSCGSGAGKRCPDPSSVAI